MEKVKLRAILQFNQDNWEEAVHKIHSAKMPAEILRACLHVLRNSIKARHHNHSIVGKLVIDPVSGFVQYAKHVEITDLVIYTHIIFTDYSQIQARMSLLGITPKYT